MEVQNKTDNNKYQAGLGLIEFMHERREWNQCKTPHSY